ncbi:hypothetical protein Tco_1098579 [Tanacetum coccineum]
MSERCYGRVLSFEILLCAELRADRGSARVVGDDDDEDVDDIEHEFNIDGEQNKNKNIAEALLRGRMSLVSRSSKPL